MTSSAVQWVIPPLSSLLPPTNPATALNTDIRTQLDEYVAEFTKDNGGKPPAGPLKPPSWDKHDVANLFQELSAHIKELEEENERLSKILTD